MKFITVKSDLTRLVKVIRNIQLSRQLVTLLFRVGKEWRMTNFFVLISGGKENSNDS